MSWIEQIFGSRSAEEGGVVRRSVYDVKKFSSFPELLDAVKARGFQLIETGDQYVIICNGGSIQIHC